VPSARLELAQLSPLPPQDSVSTNFTTTARVARQGAKEGLRHQDSLTVYPEKLCVLYRNQIDCEPN